MTIGSDTSFSS